MLLRYSYWAYPDASQCRALAKAFGCARVVWNDCLRDRREAHAAGLPYVTSGELSRRRITQAKRTEERAWLAEMSAVVLQQSLRDLDAAYKSFFDSIKGKRRGRKVGPPRYKSKKDRRQSIRLNTNAFSLRGDGTVYVAKVGSLKVRWSRRLPAAPDHNAACNVLAEGRRIVAAGRVETSNACGARVRRVHVPAQRGEAGSPRKGQPTQTGIPGLQAREHVKPLGSSPFPSEEHVFCARHPSSVKPLGTEPAATCSPRCSPNSPTRG
ncbi:transposase [Streptomyces sp. NPDC002055]|uniref:RNA-guided endonuclease InsQ/TnpB family protein n=1 Tax=Streptomyces sp. NPDC002055 TaxID=3154534 RepID=UPI0033260BE7